MQLFAQAQGRLRYDERHRGAGCRARRGRSVVCVGGANGRFALAIAAEAIAEGRGRGAVRLRSACRRAEPEATPPRPLWLVPVPDGERRSLCRSAQRRHRRRYRARRPRGLRRDRACQALHHARHGHRPGQDRQPRPALALLSAAVGARHRRDRHDDFRPPYVPVAFGASCRARARRAVRPGAGDADARVARRRRARCSRMSGSGSGRATIRVRRGHGRGGAARVPRGARRGGGARCLDPRQDRDRRARRGGVSRPHLHQPLRARSSPAGAATG